MGFTWSEQVMYEYLNSSENKWYRFWHYNRNDGAPHAEHELAKIWRVASEDGYVENEVRWT